MRQATWIQGLRAAVLLALLTNPTMAEGPGVRFEFRLEPDEVLTVDKYQDIRIFNGLAWDSREEKNRIILRVVDRRDDGAVLDGQFLTYSRSPRLTGEFRQEQTFDSHFLIHKNGNYEVPEQYVMPNLQSLPSFPDRPVSPGDRWNAPAVETMDFVSVRLRLPVSVNYEYAGPTALPAAANLGEQSFDLIRYRYSFRHRGAGNILQINGFSSCELWFDREAGIPVFDTNRLVYEFILADGSRQEFLFRIDSWYRKRRQVSVADREEMVESIGEHLPDNGNLQVRQTDEGVALDLNAILFARPGGFDTVTLSGPGGSHLGAQRQHRHKRLQPEALRVPGKNRGQGSIAVERRRIAAYVLPRLWRNPAHRQQRHTGRSRPQSPRGNFDRN